MIRMVIKHEHEEMSREDTLRRWAQRPSDSEQSRIDRTERMIKEAISGSSDTNLKNASVFAKGSVRMRTNIRSTSDIDVCVRAANVFFADYPEGTSNGTYGNTDSPYSFSEFRKSVEDAIHDYFGSEDVDTSGNKAIRINAGAGNSRIDADVVPAFEHRRYTSQNSSHYHEGIELRHKNNPSISVKNWPDHNYNNALSKHGDTYRRYRKMVRILKRMREAMKENGITSAEHAYSFLIESLLWNVPNEYFGNSDYEDDLQGVIEYLRFHLADQEKVKEWGEVNELKYLFNSQQKWTRTQAYNFIVDAEQFFREMQ